MLLKLSDWLVYGGLGLDPETRFGGAVHFFVYDTLKIFLLLAVMIFMIGGILGRLPLGHLLEKDITESVHSGRPRHQCPSMCQSIVATMIAKKTA